MPLKKNTPHSKPGIKLWTPSEHCLNTELAVTYFCPVCSDNGDRTPFVLFLQNDRHSQKRTDGVTAGMDPRLVILLLLIREFKQALYYLTDKKLTLPLTPPNSINPEERPRRQEN